MRELTKLYEEHRRENLEELITYYEANPPSSECVLLIEPIDLNPTTSLSPTMFNTYSTRLKSPARQIRLCDIAASPNAMCIILYIDKSLTLKYL